MVDPKNTNPDKIKMLMGRTPSYFKSKFMSVLGSSNELINGISNRFDMSLNLSNTSEVNLSPDDDHVRNNYSDFDDDDDESLDENIIDFESRKAKERRARDELHSGRYRQPKFLEKIRPDKYPDDKIITQNLSSSLSSISIPDAENPSNATSSVCEVPCDDIFETNTFEATTISSRRDSTQPDHQRDKVNFNNISTTTSENGLNTFSDSAVSSDDQIWMRSESNNSVPSGTSSINPESQTEDSILEFMRTFVSVLFDDNSAITLDIKAEFGNKSRSECGRLWFARLISAQRGRYKRVSESTFFSIIQYFAIVLFECHDSEDFSPAKILMNMCFTFYHEVEVPGCEPYREYVYTYLRDQPIWQSLRYWNAAFFDALQCERINHPVVRATSAPFHSSGSSTQNQKKQPRDMGSTQSEPSNDLWAVDAGSSSCCENKVEIDRLSEIQEDQVFQQNISFGQLGTFTCNMHAFGLSRQLCNEFLRKQCVIANLSDDQEKLLRDNMNRMYKETDKWRN